MKITVTKDVPEKKALRLALLADGSISSIKIKHLANGSVTDCRLWEGRCEPTA